jgi:L-lactate dehydrogenase complex protein LldE
MGRDRVADYESAGAEVITSADMSCLMHLSGISRREQRPLHVMHVAQILAGRSLPA